jgi:hemoglobin
MSDTRIRSADERRAEIQAHAARLGIDDELISTLVDTFYAHIRQDPALGPIFDEAIGDRWDRHLPVMKDFWASVALNAGRYSGKPVPAHTKLKGVEPEHFDIWLGLFEQTLKDVTQGPEAVSYFMERATRIASSLKLAMFGMSGLPPLAKG